MKEKHRPSKIAGGETSSSKWRSHTIQRVSDNISRGYPGDLQTTARAIAAGLMLRVREMIARDLDAVLDKYGISHVRHQVLAIVCRSAGGIQISELAIRASVHPTTMTSTINRLRRDGLIKRRTVPKDRRAILIVATPKGEELYEQTREALAASEFALGAVDVATIQQLTEALDTVAAALEQDKPGG
jgi:DNA-binding MarR family transcriptional regulator